MRTLLAIAAAIALLAALPAGAATPPSPARTGESGLVDVPDAEVIGPGGGLLGMELRLDRAAGEAVAVGPFPLYAVAGITRRIDAGFTMREWGQPGDPRPAGLVYGGALKLQLLPSSERGPAIAVDATMDRIGAGQVLGSRLIASTSRTGRLRFAAFLGGELGDARGLSAGGAIAVAHRSGTEAVVEALTSPRGPNLGLALRWRTFPTMMMSAGLNYLPKDEGFRVSLGFALGPSGKKATTESARPAAQAEEEAPAAATAQAAGFREDRPRFRLRLRTGEGVPTEPKHLQHAAYAPPAPAGPSMPGRAGPKVATLNVDDVLEAQLREQEAQNEARERRLRAGAESLAARATDLAAEDRRLGERERALRDRTAQLDAREKRIALRGAPTQAQRQLESQEAQLAGEERQLLAQERGLAPAVEAAQGNEQDAAAREDAERKDVSRLTASASSVSGRAQQLELRKQAAAAKGRQLASLEARLVAAGEHADALDRQLRLRAERIDAIQRRLDVRAERLDLLERRAAGALAGPEAGARPERPDDAVAPKDKAVFVMVVKSPTALVKEQAGGAAPAVAAAPAATTNHPGLAVEKAVAAATVVMFPTPATELSELDRDAVDNVAKLAAKERCELLVWARAKDPSLMAEAQRRANELRARAVAAGPLEERQVVTRITTRPGAQGVDVVVSALREPAAGAAPGAQPSGGAGAPEAGLVAGEAGRRQIREAVVAAQPAIEACVGQLLEARRLSRAEGVLRLAVSPKGAVEKVQAGAGDLSGAELEACLGRAAKSWKFPPADAEYAVEVPITILRSEGAAR